MTDITTEAGKRPLAEANFTGGEVYFGEPGRWEAEVAAIEAEAAQKAAEAEYYRYARMVSEMRAVERARLRERVEALPPTVVTNASWDKRGVLHIAHETMGGTQMLDRAAVLAILEEEE